MKKYYFSFLLLSTILLLCIGCNNTNKYSEESFHFDEKVFNSQWNLWNKQNIENYSFTLVEGYYWNNTARGVPDPIIYEFNIIVKNGKMDSFKSNVYDFENNPVEGYFQPKFTTISEMYQKIFESASRMEELWKINQFDGMYLSTAYIIEYNNELNYITFFNIVHEWDPSFFGSPLSPIRVTNFSIIN